MTPFLAEIAAIKSDSTSGSLAIVNRTLDAVRYLVRSEEVSSEALVLTLRHTMAELLDVHGQLMVLRHFIEELLAGLEAIEPGEEPAPAIDLLLEGYARQWANAELNIAGQFTQTAHPHGKTIVLHSQSTTICRLFDHLKENNVHVAVVQTESRPRLEGRLQAQYIAALGFPVTIIPDAALQHAVEWAEIAVVGADAVLRDRFINKIGTYPLALACAQYKVPLFVLADSRKFITTNEWPGEQQRPGSEQWNSPPDGVTAWNQYFEPTPNRLVTSFITEQSKIFPLGTEEF